MVEGGGNRDLGCCDRDLAVSTGAERYMRPSRLAEVLASCRRSQIESRCWLSAAAHCGRPGGMAIHKAHRVTVMRRYWCCRAAGATSDAESIRVELRRRPEAAALRDRGQAADSDQRLILLAHQD